MRSKAQVGHWSKDFTSAGPSSKLPMNSWCSSPPTRRRLGMVFVGSSALRSMPNAQAADARNLVLGAKLLCGCLRPKSDRRGATWGADLIIGPLRPATQGDICLAYTPRCDLRGATTPNDICNSSDQTHPCSQIKANLVPPMAPNQKLAQGRIRKVRSAPSQSSHNPNHRYQTSTPKSLQQL